jgi:hypothetical protein
MKARHYSTLCICLIVSLVTTLCSCCGVSPPVAAPMADMRTAAEMAEAKSAVIIGETSGKAICGAVWVSHDELATVAHCVKDVGRPPVTDELEKLEEALGMKPPWNAVGKAAHYSDVVGASHPPFAQYPIVIIKVDLENDLALLKVPMDSMGYSLIPPHDVARLATREIHKGEELDVIGSTVGLPFTYSHCYVAAVREPGSVGNYFRVIQVSGPVYYGNSGGPAFDSAGALVGMADYMLGDEDGPYPDVSFFTHASVIEKFLRGN